MKRRDEVAVGALLVVTLVLGLGGTLWIARGGLSSGYEMYAKFPWGAGLKQGQPVLLAGVNVGFVSDVELVPDGTLLVKMSIKKDYHIPIGSTATVAVNGIFGDQLIALTPVRATTQFLPERDTIPTGVPSPGISDLLAKGDSITTDVKALTGRIRTELVDDGGIKEVRKTIVDMSKLMTQITTVVNDQSKQLTSTQAQLRKTLASIDSAKVDSTVTNFRAASANLERLSRSLDSTRLEVNGLITKVNSGNGSIGLLLNDRTTFDRANNLLARMDSLLADIKKNPKKYINVKVF
ncbi:MAG: MlaD family protein [Gemmatimonadota bacterium]|nr:MlaD family protein [Gemmatimonadota bacterium]